jgi:hypothetical protein
MLLIRDFMLLMAHPTIDGGCRATTVRMYQVLRIVEYSCYTCEVMAIGYATKG